MAAAMVAGVAQYLDYIPKIIIVEAKMQLVMEYKGKIEKISIEKESILGGMSCGEVSLIPWEILKNSVSYCIYSRWQYFKYIKGLANSDFCDEKIIGGECSTPGIISLIGLYNNKSTKDELELNDKSNVLLFGCEGDADEELYYKLLNK